LTIRTIPQLLSLADKAVHQPAILGHLPFPFTVEAWDLPLAITGGADQTICGPFLAESHTTTLL